jgi:cobalt/nickel transport system permease protein
MHIPDAVLDPKAAAATAAVAVAGLAYGLSRLRTGARDRTTVLMGVASAAIFAAQMVNFPLIVIPASGHLLGGVLAAVLLGPWAGSCVIAAVLIVQCLLCGDGGLTALGANFVNMGLIGSVGGYAIYDPIRRSIGGRRGVLIGSMIAAWFSVILASGAFAVELAAAGGRTRFLDVLGWMVLVHAVIGVGEAVITGLVVRYVLQVRPDLIDSPDTTGERPAARWGRTAAAGLGLALAVATFLAPLALLSPEHDGLEHVGAKLAFLDGDDPAHAPIIPAAIPDYELPGLAWKPLAVSAAGAVGTLAVFLVGLTLARVFTSPAAARGASQAGWIASDGA